MRNLYPLILALVLIQSNAIAQNYSLLFLENEYATVADNSALDITGDFTVEAWIYPTLFTAYGGIVSKYQNPSAMGITLRLSSTGHYRGLCINEMETVDDILQANQWYHIAAVKNGANLKIYVNGIEYALSGTPMTVSANSDPLRIGVDFMAGGGRYFMGKIDDVRIWNIARSQTQIKSQIFNRSIAVDATGLVAYYSMNEGNGTTAHNSCTNTSGIDASLVSSFIWATSPIQFDQNCLILDGSNDHITVADQSALDITADFTYEAWIKPAGFNWLGGIISKYQSGASSGNTFRLSYAGNFRGLSINNYITADNLLTINTWHHVAATRSGNTYAIYIDGISYPLSGSDMVVTANSDPLRIGVDYLDAGSPRYFNGSIDEVRIWNVARSQAQIQANMNKELDPSTQVGLVAYYTFDQGIPDGTNTGMIVVPDLKNDHNGLLSNFSLTGTSSNFSASFGTMITLPLKWQYVTAFKKDDRIDVSWKVRDCSSCVEFLVEKSVDAIQWISNGSINAIKGKFDYSWTDFNPSSTTIYYRIVAKNLDGTKQYSSIMIVRYESTSEKPLRVISNPMKDQLIFQNTVLAELVLISSSGSPVWKGIQPPGMHTISLSGLAQGIYYLHMKEQVVAIVKW